MEASLSFLSWSFRYARAFSTRPLPDSPDELPVDLAEFGGGLRGLGQVAHVGRGQHRLDFEQQLRDPHAGRVGDLRDHLGHLLRLLFGDVPQAVLGDFEVLGPDLVGAVQVGERPDHADRLELPPVAGPNALLRQLAEDRFERLLRLGRPRQRLRRSPGLLDLGRA